MKYIKTYEIELYKVSDGDYVILKDHFVVKIYSILGKIIDTQPNSRRFRIRRYSDIGQKSEEWYSHYDIERKMTPEEILEYDRMDKSNKYNL
jgi:hypothetical protein